MKETMRVQSGDDRHYQVSWSEEDQRFVGLCADFPSLSALRLTQAEALEDIRTLVAAVVADMEDNGETIPPATM